MGAEGYIFLSCGNIRMRARQKTFKKWYWWATHARLKPLAKAAKMIKEHLPNILTYLKHRITNAVAEGLIAKYNR